MDTWNPLGRGVTRLATRGTRASGREGSRSGATDFIDGVDRSQTQSPALEVARSVQRHPADEAAIGPPPAAAFRPPLAPAIGPTRTAAIRPRTAAGREGAKPAAAAADGSSQSRGRGQSAPYAPERARLGGQGPAGRRGGVPQHARRDSRAGVAELRGARRSAGRGAAVVRLAARADARDVLGDQNSHRRGALDGPSVCLCLALPPCCWSCAVHRCTHYAPAGQNARRAGRAPPRRADLACPRSCPRSPKMRVAQLSGALSRRRRSMR